MIIVSPVLTLDSISEYCHLLLAELLGAYYRLWNQNCKNISISLPAKNLNYADPVL